MINIGKILKRSWQILWNYRILWVFGILLALTAGGGSSGSSGGNTSRTSQGNTSGLTGGLPEGAPDWMRQLAQWFVKDVEPIFTHPAEHINTIVMMGVIIFLVVLICSVIAALVRYPSETAVIRMVDEYEQSGSKVSFRQGWKLGWTRRAFRLWLIDLVLSIPPVVLLLLLASAGLIAYKSMSSTFQVTNVMGVVAAVALGTLSIVLLIAVSVFLTLLRNFFARYAALEGLGVKASLQQGWSMFKRNWKSAGLMWLVMIGIGIAFGIVSMVAFFLLIPAYLILLLPAALAAILPALIGYGITSIFTSGPLTWIIALLAAAPFFFIILFVPFTLIGGWYKIYESNIWTLTYREIKAMQNLQVPALPVESIQSPEKNQAV